MKCAIALVRTVRRFSILRGSDFSISLSAAKCLTLAILEIIFNIYFQSHNPGIHGSNKVSEQILGLGASKADVSLRTLANATLALVDGIALNVSHAHDDDA